MADYPIVPILCNICEFSVKYPRTCIKLNSPIGTGRLECDYFKLARVTKEEMKLKARKTLFEALND